MVISLVAAASAFTPPQPVCNANLAFVGTVVSLTPFYLEQPTAQNPGLVATRVLLNVDRVVYDTVGDTSDGQVSLVILGGTIGNHKVVVSEMPNPAIGDRWSFVVNWYPDKPYPFLRWWSYIPPETSVPTQSVLQQQWAATCGG